jgi:hypothetical protein
VEIILSSKSINLRLSEYPNNATLLAACQTMKTLIDVTNSQRHCLLRIYCDSIILRLSIMLQRIVINLDSRALHILNSGAPEPRGQRGQLPPLPKHCGGNTGATDCPFCQNCASKFVHYSQELEFRTIFKQCLKMRYNPYVNKGF